MIGCIAWHFAVGAVAGTVFSSTAFRLDTLGTNGVARVAASVEQLEMSPSWQSGLPSPFAVATVLRIASDGTEEILGTVSGDTRQAVSWDTSRLPPGEHVLRHSITDVSGTLVDSLTATFIVPQPRIVGLTILGPDSVYGGETGNFSCVATYSNGETENVTPDWSLSSGMGAGTVDSAGTFTAQDVSVSAAVTILASFTCGGATVTATKDVSVQPAFLSLAKASMSAAKVKASYELGISCSGAWNAASGEEWLTIKTPASSGNGVLVFEVAKNTVASTRKAVITVTSGSRTAKCTVKQAVGEPDVVVTVAFDACGGTSTESRQYVVGEAYGFLPTVTYPGWEFAGWWTGPNGTGSRVLPATPVSADVTVLYAAWAVTSMTGALNNDLDWIGDLANPWVPDAGVSLDGKMSMRSAAIDDSQSSSLSLNVKGPGVLAFYWRVSSESDFDVLSFFDGLAEIATISGETKWIPYTHVISDSDMHELRWVYSKDDADGNGMDCGWLDLVAWTPNSLGTETVLSAGGIPVPVRWCSDHGLVPQASALALDSDGDGFANWEEFVAGTDPNDNQSRLGIRIEVPEGGDPVLYAVPYLGEARNYTFVGKTNLTDAAWIAPTNSSHRFFRVQVEMK